MSPSFLAVAVAVALSAAGCSASIGDSCTVNVDCSKLGDRICDTSELGGYCTIEGCSDSSTCPDNAWCIRILTADRTRPCVFGARFPDNQCDIDQRCLCDDSVKGVCIDNAAHCAPESSERRYCQKSCNQNGDCRDGYECRSTGTLGAEVTPSLYDLMTPAAVSFCAPKR